MEKIHLRSFNLFLLWTYASAASLFYNYSCEDSNCQTVILTISDNFIPKNNNQSKLLIKARNLKVVVTSTVQFLTIPNNKAHIFLPDITSVVARSAHLTATNQPLLAQGWNFGIFFRNNVRNLDISNNTFPELPSSFFRGCANLQFLRLLDCQITIIADTTFEDLQQLTFIDLSKNFIKHLSEMWFRDLTHLTELILDQNQLTAVDLLQFETNKVLKRISVRDNKVWRMGLTQAMNSLTSVDVAGNVIKELDFLKHLVNLQKLSISRNTEVDVNEQTFEVNTRLEELKMAKVGLSQRLNLKILFGKLTVIRNLDIGDNQLNHLDLAKFPDLPTLLELAINKNDLTRIENLGVLKTKLPALNKIEISGNNWDCIYLVTLKWNLQLDGDLMIENSEKGCKIGGLTIGVILIVVIVTTAVVISLVCKYKFYRKANAVLDSPRDSYVDRDIYDSEGYVIIQANLSRNPHQQQRDEVVGTI